MGKTKSPSSTRDAFSHFTSKIINPCSIFVNQGGLPAPASLAFDAGGSTRDPLGGALQRKTRRTSCFGFCFRHPPLQEQVLED